MASPETSTMTADSPERSVTESSQAWRMLEQGLRPLASLKLTVALFLAAIVIVLAGTFAQVDKDIWEVIRDYFRVDFRSLRRVSSIGEFARLFFVWIPANLFFPPSFAPNGGPNFPSWMGIWFPKGWIIGTLMMFNLVAAHLLRFRVQAHGSRLLTGWVFIGLGAILTLAVIIGGSTAEGLQAEPLISYKTVWTLVQMTLFGLCGVSVYAAAAAKPDQPAQRWAFGSLAVALGVAAIASFQMQGSSDATMRILYQLIQATLAGVVLLAGCIAVFRKRAGIVLLHAGIGVMMFYDVLVGTEHVESQMHIVEGETVWFSRDMRVAELAIIDHAPANDDLVNVVDAHRLQQDGQTIQDPLLPIRISVVSYMKNSGLRGPRETDADGKPFPNPATAGLGRQVIAQPQAGATGTDTTGGIDVPSAYVTLTAPDGKELGTYLLSAHFDLTGGKQSVTVDGKTYEIALRFRRIYNDFSITLDDVKKEDYHGTDRARDFSSYIQLKDPARNIDFPQRIWMNNPMRYGGKTFYQSSYARLENGEMTTLQVVDNAGWMTPYVACMMVVVGMLYHFGLTLLRFLDRRARETGRSLAAAVSAGASPDSRAASSNRNAWALALGITLVGALFFAKVARPPQQAATDYRLYEFGQLPMWYKGRAMPIDTFARNALLQLSDRESFKAPAESGQPPVTLPARLWLLDLMADVDKARDHRVIRVESIEVRDAVGLERREGLTYSINEIDEQIQSLIEQAMEADKTPSENRTLVQRKLIELARRVVFYSFLERTLGQPPQLPREDNDDPQNAMSQVVARAGEYLDFISAARRVIEEYAARWKLGPLPLVVPTHLGVAEPPKVPALDTKWEPLTIAMVFDQFYSEFPAKTPPAIDHFAKMLEARRQGNPAAFNTELDAYQQLLKENDKLADLPLAKVHFEGWYNQFSAFHWASFVYVLAGVLAVLGWLFYPQGFQRASFCLILLTFAVHTFALVARIYISGRPPVTNLYSSAIFIGWAVVLGGMIIERLTKLGIGNVVAAVAGFTTLRIAHALAAQGDTFVVLEAVLDTQFWLATHVVCITLGYATTYLAGLLGALSILLGLFSKRLTPSLQRELTRMTYGALCFALFFSFWGTVLGGLWADDSWGRFWGWDPKENGALIIVLWNALVLHARWDGMIRDRGLAVLSLLGNVVVSWSWFGVNELGVGLHSYGFTEGTLRTLGLFAASQLLLAGLGCLPKALWRSQRQGNRPEVMES